MKLESFTVLELWNEKKIHYSHFVLANAGVKISESYRKKYNKIPEKIEVFEKETKKTFKVNVYPASFKKEASIILNWILEKYENKPPPKEKLKEKQAREKRPRIKRKKYERN